MINEVEKVRENWIDCAKGIGIILVVLGHTYSIPTWLQSWIYAFHMPLFFILSGYTIRVSSDISIKKQICKFAKAYLLPYLFLSLTNLLLQSVWLFYIHELTTQRIVRYLVGILYCYANIEWMPNCSPLWFLVGIFISKSLFSIVIAKLPPKWHFPCFLSCICISYSISLSELPRLPWNMMPALMGTFFIWLGWKLRNNNVLAWFVRTKKAWIFWATLILLAPFVIRNGKSVGMNENQYGNLLWFLSGAIGFSLATMVLAIKISNCTFLASFWGKNTIIVIAFNYFSRFLSTELYYMIPIIRQIKLTWPISFLITIIVLACIIHIYSTLQVSYKKRSGNKIKRIEQ